ncbi:hypothetical protein VE00_07880 [Pseudogymnoascus sp. WSF 3629]|nr:hypothetical protein VE00_07880 [Pseudogymnoascus sp. WSF 3629]
MKSKALRALYPQSAISTCRKFGIANICIDSTTENEEHPVLLAESVPYYAQAKSRGKPTCHETSNHPVPWPSLKIPRRQEFIDHVQARLLSLFTDVMCLFAQDYGGLDAVAETLMTWATIGPASNLEHSIRPRLLIVANIPGNHFASEAMRLQLKVLSHPGFSNSFSSLNVINVLGASGHTPRGHFSAFEQVLTEEIRLQRAARINTHTLFSMVHIAAFFDLALQNFALSPLSTFSFIHASREDFKVSPNFPNHLTSFISVFADNKLPDHTAWEFIASVIILDAYPPDMHMFSPSEVFRVLYREGCVLGIQEYLDSQQLSTNLVCADIEASMISMFSQMKHGSQSSASLRRQCLERNSESGKLLKLPLGCMGCLQRTNEHPFDCGHAICDVCVSIFGTPSRGLEYHYELTQCLFCSTEITFQARLVPPTCRIRLFATDGGGSKGVVTIGFIQKLQQALDPDRPVQDNADFSIGTSTGGVINLGLFGKNWTPEQCLTFFCKFAKIIFASKAKARSSIWSWVSLCSWISWIMRISGGRYDADILEKFLQEAYGTTPMFHTARPSGMKYAVTATTLSDATLCLISNYHTEGKPTSNLGYKHLPPTSDKGEILIWEAARCTTAAPTIFKPKRLRSYGTFQDGGLRNNNPVRPGLRLVSRIWEDGDDCDIVLSIGNGFEQKPLSPVASNFRNLFLDGALARLYRASMESLSLNGQNSWDDHWHGLDEETKTNHFRLNLPLEGKEPGIDDIDSMDSLYQKTMCHQGDMFEIVRAFKAVTLFFELDRCLVEDGPFYICYGSILCRSPDAPRFIQLLTSDYPYAQFFNHGTSLGYISKNDICKLCGRYTKLVAFRVRHSSDQADINLRFNRLYHRRISAFPKPIDWFIEKQKLNAKFGQPNHKSTAGPRQSDCSCQLQRKRDIPISLPGNLKRPLVARTRTRRKKLRLVRGNGE